MSGRCPKCDRETCRATTASGKTLERFIADNEPGSDCARHAVDWRARALRAEEVAVARLVALKSARSRLLSSSIGSMPHMQIASAEAYISAAIDEHADGAAELHSLLKAIDSACYALVTARATIKIADETPRRFNTAQAGATLKQIHDALVEIDEVRR